MSGTIKFPVKVPDGKGGVLVLHAETEVSDYQRRIYAEGAKIRNSMGEPEPNFSVQPSYKEWLKLRQRL